MLKYKCLVLDHDDTVVKSTPLIHYPSFKKTLCKLRPDVDLSLDDFIMNCFDPGFSELCIETLGFSEEEMEYQVSSWNEYVKEHIPDFYDGFKELLYKFKKEGGIICVVSHSLSHNIKRDYEKNCDLVPDMIFGWDRAEEERKPYPFPLEEIMRKYNLKPSELIMVDDLKPGFEMAKSCGVDFVAAGWSHTNEKISAYMKENCDYYFDNIKQLEKLLFEQN